MFRAHPAASPEQIAFFREHGWIVVKDAIPQDHLDQLEAQCEVLIREKDKLANDWAWSDQEDIKGADNYLNDALTAAMAGKPVAVNHSRPYGCSVKYAD